MWKFYRDLTRFAVLFALVCIPLGSLISAVILFGVLGTPIGLLMFNYFQKDEFYGYYNLGYTKLRLISITWLINLAVTPILLLIAFLILKLISLGALTS